MLGELEIDVCHEEKKFDAESLNEVCTAWQVFNWSYVYICKILFSWIVFWCY